MSRVAEVWAGAAGEQPPDAGGPAVLGRGVQGQPSPAGVGLVDRCPGVDDLVDDAQALVAGGEYQRPEPALQDAYDAINSDSELFVGALRSYQNGYQSAFEETLPHVRGFPSDLLAFLASELAKPLTGQASPDEYLSSLRSTHASPA